MELAGLKRVETNHKIVGFHMLMLNTAIIIKSDGAIILFKTS